MKELQNLQTPLSKFHSNRNIISQRDRRMAPTSAPKWKICLRLDVHSKDHQTACIFEESSLFGLKPQFQSFTIWRGRLQWQLGASPRDYMDSIYAKERSKVSFIHDFGGCGVNVEVFDRTVQGCSTVIDQLDNIVEEVLREVMKTQWRFHDCKSLADYISSAMSQNCAGKMREDLFAPFRRYEVNLAAEREEGLSDVALKRNSPLHYRMLKEKLQADAGLVRFSGLASQELSAGALESALESIINPMTNSDGALESAAMDKNRAGKGKVELFGPKDNLAVGLSDITFTGHGGGLLGLSLQGGAGKHQSTNPLTNSELYHSPEAIQRRDGGSGLANSQDGAPVEGAAVHKTRGMKWFASLATAGKDIYSSLASLGVSVSPDDVESQGADIPVLERIHHVLSEHDQTVQQWLRDAGTVGASFSAVYASPSLTTQLPAVVAFFTTLTAMWLSRKRTRTRSVLTKIGALACIASVMSAMVKYLSPVGMAIAGPLLLIPAGVVILAEPSPSERGNPSQGHT